MRVGGAPDWAAPGPPPGQRRYLSYAGLLHLTRDDLLALDPATPPEDRVILAESPDPEQERHLHALAQATKIALICIHRQDQLETGRLLQVIAGHPNLFSESGWADPLLQKQSAPEEGLEFLNAPTHFHLVTNSIPYLLAYLDREITYRFINDPFCQWFGLPRSAILGHSMRELIGEEAFKIARPHIQQALSGQRTSLINHIHRADGSIRTARFNYIPDRQSNGRVRGFISSIDDITYQVQVEEQLRQSEHRLRTIITNIPVVLFTLDMEGIFTLSEGKGLQTLDLEPGGVVGHSIFEVYRENERLLKNIRRALEGEAFQELMEDQHGRFFDAWYSPLLDGDGRQQGILGVLADMTERVQMETALKISEERYRTLVENQDEGVLITDAELRIEYLNLAAEAVLKYSSGELLGRKLDELFTPRQRATLTNQFETRKKGESSTYELTYRAPTGEKHLLMVTATPRFDSKGSFVGSFAVIRDITERKLVEENLRYRSTHDALTGLYNRFFFDEELSRLEENHRQPISMLMIDLDGLKAINDTQGHFTGDEVLRRAAQLVRACLRGEDLVARLGGDEFAVLLPNTRPTGMERIIQRIRRLLVKYNQKHPNLPFQISIGGATALPGQSLRKALEKADQQLYEEKRRKASTEVLADRWADV